MTFESMVACLQEVVGRQLAPLEHIHEIEVDSLDVLEWLFTIEADSGHHLDAKAIEIVESGTLQELFEHLTSAS